MAAAPRPTANTPTPTSGSDRAELVYQVLGNEKFRPPRAGQVFSCTDLPRKRVRRKIGRPRCVIHGSSSSTEPRCGRRKNSVFGDSHPAFLSVYLEVRFPSFHLFSAPAPGSARRLRLALQAFRVLRKSAPLKKRNAAFVEIFLRAFQLLRTAVHCPHIWHTRIICFQELRLLGKIISCRKFRSPFSNFQKSSSIQRSPPPSAPRSNAALALAPPSSFAYRAIVRILAEKSLLVDSAPVRLLMIWNIPPVPPRTSSSDAGFVGTDQALSFRACRKGRFVCRKFSLNFPTA